MANPANPRFRMETLCSLAIIVDWLWRTTLTDRSPQSRFHLETRPCSFVHDSLRIIDTHRYTAEQRNAEYDKWRGLLTSDCQRIWRSILSSINSSTKPFQRFQTELWKLNLKNFSNCKESKIREQKFHYQDKELLNTSRFANCTQNYGTQSFISRSLVVGYTHFFFLRPIFERHNAWITRVSYSKDDQIYCSVACNMLPYACIFYVYTFEKMKPECSAFILWRYICIYIYMVYIYVSAIWKGRMPNNAVNTQSVDSHQIII